MSQYLIDALDHAGVVTQDESEIARLDGTEAELEAVTLRDGSGLAMSSLFLFLGAEPRTDWLGDAIARDSDGFIVTGDRAGSTSLLETSVPRVYAAGDVRAGSFKRCAAAIAEGSAVVQFVHHRLAAM